MALKINKLNAGDRISYTDYMTIRKVVSDNEILVANRSGAEFTIRGKQLIESMMDSDSQYEKTEKLGKNALAEILFTSGDSIMTVTFTKQDGSTRKLVGYFLSQDTNLGRSNFMDLEANGTRQVDHRTVSEIIVRNVRYTAK